MKEQGMLEHIVKHSLLVSKVALYLSEELNKKGENIDLSKVQAGALLHDITKTKGITTGEDHAQTGSKFLKELGYKSISDIVRMHVMSNVEGHPFKISEIEIVHYADKRVKHDRVVTLQERFEDLRKRYDKAEGKGKLISQLEEKTKEIEKKIFARVDISPETLLTIQG